MATHSRVTMPVLSHSQKRKKCEGMACRSRARCACARCRKIVTEAMVTCVVASVNSTICHHAAFTKPSASQETLVARSERERRASDLEGDARRVRRGARDLETGRAR